MNEETIVAMFDNAAQADRAVQDLDAAHVPSNAVSRHPSSTGDAATNSREPGFWSNLFGGEPDHDTAVYDRIVATGSHMVAVRVPQEHVTGVLAILERHNPVDIDERAKSYGLGAPGAGAGTTVGQPADAARLGATGARTDTAAGTGGETLQLAEEQLVVGKRLVDRGTTRVRRFVVETPVEENVTLHSERVSVERRPVSGNVPVTDADFTDRTIEMNETDEEAVVSKTARVKEEVVVHKDVADRVDTVKDTVRREDVEITKDGVSDRTDGRMTDKASPIRR